MLRRAGCGQQLEGWSDGCAELVDTRGKKKLKLKAGEVRGEVGDGEPELAAEGAALLDDPGVALFLLGPYAGGCG